DHGFKFNVNAHRVEPLCQPQRIRIQAERRQHLGADGDYFSVEHKILSSERVTYHFANYVVYHFPASKHPASERFGSAPNGQETAYRVPASAGGAWNSKRRRLKPVLYTPSFRGKKNIEKLSWQNTM